MLLSVGYKILAENVDEGSLIFSQVLMRHGDRTPCWIYQTDPYRELSNWPEGLCNLTPGGKQRCFELGQWLGTRYTRILSHTNNSEEIFVRSTNLTRTIMSARYTMAGLLNKTVEEYPTLVHTTGSEKDILLYYNHTQCPQLTKLKTELQASEDIKNLLDNSRDMLDYISYHSGRSMETIHEVSVMYDTLLTEQEANKTLPGWTKKVFPGGEFEKLLLVDYLVYSWNSQIKRLQAGPFLSQLVNNFDAFTTNNLVPPDQKIFLYAGHDLAIGFVLNTLGIFDGLAPPYSSAVLFELYNIQGSYKVQIYWRNTSSMEPTVLRLPGCTKMCPLERFKMLTAWARPTDWEYQCQLDLAVDDEVIKFLEAVLPLFLLLLGLLATILVLTRLGKSTTKKSEETLLLINKGLGV